MRKPVLIDRIQAAEILSVSPRTFNRMLNRSPWIVFPHSIGKFGKNLYRKSDVVALKKHNKRLAKPVRPLAAAVPVIPWGLI